MKTFLSAAVLLVSTTATGLASGGFGCEAKTADASIGFNVMTGRGKGSPLMRAEGRVELSTGTVAEDLRVTEFSTWSLTQYWSEDQELRLLAYKERAEIGPHGHIQLIIRAKSTAEADLEGRFSVEVVDMTGDEGGQGKTLRFEGAISCAFE